MTKSSEEPVEMIADPPEMRVRCEGVLLEILLEHGQRNACRNAFLSSHLRLGPRYDVRLGGRRRSELERLQSDGRYVFAMRIGVGERFDAAQTRQRCCRRDGLPLTLRLGQPIVEKLLLMSPAVQQLLPIGFRVGGCPPRPQCLSLMLEK